MNSETEAGTSPEGGAAEPPEPRRSRPWTRILAALGLVIVAGGGVQLMRESERTRTTAMLSYELRLSGDAVGPALLGGDHDEGRLLVELISDMHGIAAADGPRWTRDEGNRMIVSGRFPLTKAGKPEAIVVSRARISNFRFGLDLPPNPAPTHGFDGWRRADVAFSPDGEPITAGLEQYELRLRIERKLY
ncbi:hypothetical protein E8L99_12635 [Phreatobacter aquaticus]|uniref:Uncharacterized protein n=1 Tax=Phreatobacter aquaticus TaxID=2570229 RepID=A0A4D7QKP3_9HYPH|nr:hypothetical protein [Phreatobacter aquaticus]QCK86543.1 hypothetical protein E8L99_12635 [Phreatobacter aquaticus]